MADNSSPSFWLTYWKPLLAASCLGVLLTAVAVLLTIGAWQRYRQRQSVEADPNPPLTATGTRTETESLIKKREDLLAQPLPPFLRAKNSTARPEGSPPRRSADLVPIVLVAADAKSADVETRFMQALLAGNVDGATALASKRLSAAPGPESLRLFAGLSADRGGGTFTAEKSARLPDGATATTGRVAFKDGTTTKVTVLSIDGKVDGFTAGS